MSEHELTPAEQREFEIQEEITNLLDVTADGRLHGMQVDLGRYPTNLGQLMREGVPPPEMLLPDWLVQGELHWVYAEAEAAKTWLALYLAREVIQTHCVVWFDEELGARFLTERLLSLGADPTLVERRFVYFAFPSWQMTDADAHKALLRAVQPALVVYDTATDMLAEALLDEDSGQHVTAWIKAFPEEARRLGAAQLVLDHTTKAAGGGKTKYMVGSRAKRAKAKVAYHLEMTKRFDREHVGTVVVRLTKNTPGAWIPEERTFSIGGGLGEVGEFTFHEKSLPDRPDDDAPLASQRTMEEQIVSAVRSTGRITQRKLEEVVTGKATAVRERAKTMAYSGNYGFHLEVGGPGKANEYVWDPQPQPDGNP